MATWAASGSSVIELENIILNTVKQASLYRWASAKYNFEIVPSAGDVKQGVTFGFNNKNIGTLVSVSGGAGGGESWG